MMRFELVPMARRMPISFCFCTTLTTSTLDMPSATMMMTKLRIRLFDTDWLRSAASSCELVVIQLSTVMPLPACSRAATSLASKMSVTVMSMFETPPGRSSSDCASFIVVNTQRRFRSLLPMSNRPVTCSSSSRPPAARRNTLSPTVTPRSFASSVPMMAFVPSTWNLPRTM